MARIFAVMVGLAIILGAGYVHGLWSERWEKSASLEDAVHRLEQIPREITGWANKEIENLDPRTMALAGAEGAWVRQYISTDGQQTILVILLAGRPGPMSVHRPEHCYQGVGYEMAGNPRRSAVSFGPSKDLAEFWTARFVKQQVTGTSQLRIYWGWFDGHGWKAPDWPRWTFAPLPVLYKLYIVRETRSRAEKPEEDPSITFLETFLPKVTQSLKF